MFPVFPNFWKTLVFKHERFFKQNVQTDQWSCGCSVEDGDTLPCGGRKCWYPERRNSRSSLNPSHIKYRTKNFQKFHAGKKRCTRFQFLDRKNFNFESFILSPTPFASPPFSRDAHVVFAHAAAWPHFCWSPIFISKTFEKLNDEQRHSWIWYASYHQLPGTWKHPFTNGWQSTRWWTKYLHSKWYQKSM